MDSRPFWVTSAGMACFVLVLSILNSIAPIYAQQPKSTPVVTTVINDDQPATPIAYLNEPMNIDRVPTASPAPNVSVNYMNTMTIPPHSHVSTYELPMATLPPNISINARNSMTTVMPIDEIPRATPFPTNDRMIPTATPDRPLYILEPYLNNSIRVKVNEDFVVTEESYAWALSQGGAEIYRRCHVIQQMDYPTFKILRSGHIVQTAAVFYVADRRCVGLER